MRHERKPPNRNMGMICTWCVAALACSATPCAYGAYVAHSSLRKMESLKFFVPPCGKPNGLMEKLGLYSQCMGILAKTVSQGAAPCDDGLHLWSARLPQTRIKLTPGSILEAVKDWLFVNDEYVAASYLVNLLRCKNLTLVDNPKHADLCYPSCHGWAVSKTDKVPDYAWVSQWFGFQVQNRALFRGCDSIQGSPELIGPVRSKKAGVTKGKFGFDKKTGTCARAQGLLPPNASYEMRTYGNASRTEVLGLGQDPAFKCFVGVPYFGGIFAPSDSYTVAPWTLNPKRSTLLGYFGSLRLSFRGAFHDGFRKVGKMLENTTHSTGPASELRGSSDQPEYARYYVAPFQEDTQGPSNTRQSLYTTMRSHLNFERSWSLFATAVFCWQPGGDSPTRRSFYDSWLFGCIPVIQDCAVKHYERIFGGHFFSHHSGATLADVIVVVPATANPYAVMRTLLSLSNVAILRKRALLHRLAPFLQWNAATSKSAIRMFFHTVLAPH